MSNNQSLQQAQKRAKNIKNRLSLRTPQAQSLELLHRIATDVDLHTASIQQIIEVIKTQRSRYEGSDFAFASMCFALATGVGKTRLMGAMIYYLYKAVGIKNFFVVAPNLTIYNKLREDFRYGSKKYVFKGLADVDGNNPIVVDGDNYLNVNHTMQQGFDFKTSDQFVINVFNIDKFNSKKEKGKFYDMSEYIGSSYAEYLKNLGDLVLLMDESHRYRAKTSMKSLESLEPVLGLEFTATPFTVSGSKKKEFKNVAYAYNLANAIQDGYVKTPWVATRENYDASSKKEEELERDKVIDGIQIHEQTKVKLEVFADNNALPRVKPFLMISAKDKKHADRLETRIKTEFFGGKYADKVVKVYSGSKKEMDEAIRLLLEVEKSDNPIEIVIQVMMLKEGWDVNNLYTIVPLRASASEILTEQTIGRGLRLPYGERTGDSIVDRLTIVSHDKYAEVINAARKDDSLVKNVINLDDEEQFSPQTQIQASTPVYLDSQSAIEKNALAQEILQEGTASYEQVEQVQQMIQEEAVEYIASVEIDTPQDLQSEHHQQEIQKRITSRLASVGTKPQEKPLRLVLDALAQEKKQKYISQGVTDLTESFIQHTIHVPRVTFTYSNQQVTFDTTYRLRLTFIDFLAKQESKILKKSLVSEQLERQQAAHQIYSQGTLREYIADMIIVYFSDILYDEYADWIYSMVDDIEQKFYDHFTYCSEDELKYQLYMYKDKFLTEISSQIRSLNVKKIAKGEPEIIVTDKVNVFKTQKFTSILDGALQFTDSTFPKKQIRQYVFAGFKKCVDRRTKFDSDAERLLSVVLENDESVQKRVKPSPDYFRIYYSVSDKDAMYIPDFLVETDTMMYMIEPKASNMMQDETVLAKMESAKLRVDAVNEHGSGKKRQYVLVPHDQIQEHQTLKYIVSIGAK